MTLKYSLNDFFGEGKKGKYIVLADEAHNLSDRAREMFSAEISRAEVTDIIKKLTDKKTPVYNAFSKLKRHIDSIKITVGEEKALIEKNYPENLIFILSEVQAKCDK